MNATVRLAGALLLAPLALGAQDGDSTGVNLIPLPAIFYQPETGTGFGAVLGVYGTPDARGRTAELVTSAIYTTRKQIIGDVFMHRYPRGGDYWVAAHIGFQKFPTKYWGIGNATADGAEEDYTRRFLEFDSDLQKLFGESTYAGVRVHGRFRTLTEVESGGLLAASPGLDDQFNGFGFGGILTHDARDKRLAPERGSFLTGQALVYPGMLSNTGTFSTYTLDARHYIPITEGQLIGVRALFRGSSGTAPFDLLPKVGGDKVLRGYFEGRFTDRNLLAIQGAYRFPIVWRIRGAAFAGMGQVADTPADFSASNFKASVGGGIRVLIDPSSGAAIRVDFARGLDVSSSGLYFGLSEAW